MAIDAPIATTPQPRRPQVRCPGCGILVYLPAVSCPECLTDMKTGFRPEKSFFEDDPEVIKATVRAYLKKWGKYGLALLIPILVGLYFGLGLDWFAEKKSFFDRMVMTYPAVARPYIATQKAQTAGIRESVAYHVRLMSELRKTGPVSPMDEPLLRQYTHLKPGDQIKTVMKVFASVATERYLGPRFVRRTGSNWSVIVRPAYDFYLAVMNYDVDLQLLVNDPRARRGYSFFMPVN